VKTIFTSFSFGNQNDKPAIRDLREWRMRVLDGILQGIFVIWIFALVSGVNNIYELYPRVRAIFAVSLVSLISLIIVYLATTALLAVITFYRALKYELRAGLFLFILYTLGVVGLIAASFSSYGRIFLFSFIIFSAVFLEYRYG